MKKVSVREEFVVDVGADSFAMPITIFDSGLVGENIIFTAGIHGDEVGGVEILKEVEKTDSNNVNLQLNFAFFSEKSGQWDRAIRRFQKVLVIQPDFIEAYLHLADAYEQQGQKNKTSKKALQATSISLRGRYADRDRIYCLCRSFSFFPF